MTVLLDDKFLILETTIAPNKIIKVTIPTEMLSRVDWAFEMVGVRVAKETKTPTPTLENTDG